MRTGNHERTVSRDKKILQELRHRAIRNFLVENFLHFRIAPRNRVPNHAQIRHRREIFLAIPVFPRNSQRIEQRGSRRVYVHVRASDVKSALLQHSCHRSHRRARDSQPVDVPCRFLPLPKLHESLPTAKFLTPPPPAPIFPVCRSLPRVSDLARRWVSSASRVLCDRWERRRPPESATASESERQCCGPTPRLPRRNPENRRG